MYIGIQRNEIFEFILNKICYTNILLYTNIVILTKYVWDLYEENY